MGGCGKLHNEELHNLYSSPRTLGMIETRRMRWVGHVAQMGRNRTAYRLLVGKLEGKIALRRQRHSLVNNFKMDLRVIVSCGVDLIGLA
jgi:hypothetical protein